jgi:predicted DNA-binding transcriptional regulator YafY
MGYHMARGDQLGRQWKILQTLIASRMGKSAAELADEIECHPRTVYRDLEALQIAGFPVYTRKEEGKKLWSLMDTFKTQIPIPLNLTELLALYFSRNMLNVLKNTVFYDSLTSLFKKVKTTLPLDYINYLEQFEKSLIAGPKPYKQHGDYQKTIDAVNQAIAEKRYLEISYYTMSRNQDTERTIAPYKMWFLDGAFYVIGFCQLRKDVRLFALDRIKTFYLTDEVFEVSESFSAEEFMKSSFGVFHGNTEKVKIHFDANTAGYIKEKIWHTTQKIHEQKDGSIIFETEVAGIDEIKFWIMQWGAHAKVIEPESLRKKVQSEAKAMADAYKRNPA